MPALFDPKDLPVITQEGASQATLANPAMLGTNALLVEHITLEAGARTMPTSAVNAEQFLYVIRGAGQAHAGGQVYPLAPESILWIETSDSYFLEAGAEQLEVLVCRAPAGE
jgi:quercetin dioxygenase-like cupin family protein